MSSVTSMRDPILSLKQAANQLDIDVKTVYELIRKGYITAFQLSPRGRWKVRQSVLEDYILQREEIARHEATLRNTPVHPHLREYTRRTKSSDPLPRLYVKGERWV